jgi:membrane protease YdiL (CAAX protease family)
MLIFILLTGSGIGIIPVYLGDNITKFENHLVVSGLKERNYFMLGFVFPMTMLLEEVLFRGFLLGGMILWFQIPRGLAIVSSSVIFSLYHLHVWPSFRDKKILACFMGFSFLLGLACGYFLFEFGLLGSILFHSSSVFMIFKAIFTQLQEQPKNV